MSFFPPFPWFLSHIFQLYLNEPFRNNNITEINAKWHVIKNAKSFKWAIKKMSIVTVYLYSSKIFIKIWTQQAVKKTRTIKFSMLTTKGIYIHFAVHFSRSHFVDVVVCRYLHIHIYIFGTIGARARERERECVWVFLMLTEFKMC